jgi:cytoskeletal protein RodZ
MTTKPSAHKTRDKNEKRRYLIIGAVITLVIGIVLATGFPWWFKYFESGSRNSAIVGFTGGCASFTVYSQNRWSPVGTEMRAAPNVLSSGEGSFAPNSKIQVNGWVISRPAYPTNVAPFNSGVWYHLTNGDGWVSFPGVRAAPTTFDSTGQASGGPPAPTQLLCKGAIQ